MKTAYSSYAGLDVLHNLQKPRTEVSAEMSFIVTTQVMELLFGLLAHEWVQARRALREDDQAGAAAALRRGLHVQDVLISSWDLLATVTPAEYGAFREQLGEASGFQSSAYRRLEYLLGNKSPRFDLPELAEPSLYDEMLALLHRRGLPVPASHLERDFTRPYEPHPDVEKAWRIAYEEHPDLVQLAELLLDVAQRVTSWRQRHYTSVRRVMGGRPGTGGTSGLIWLRRAVDRDSFPELWSARDEL
jgi:tryptophan 2,3-dioxygenase